MHTLGPLRNNMTFINGEIDLFINSICNSAVTIFIIISGYFGIKLKKEKMLKLWIMTVFYSLLGFIITYVTTKDFSVKELIKCCIPIISNKYWFLTCYFVLCFLSGYINDMFEKFDRQTNKSLIITLLVIFSIIPTIFQFELLQDNGKGIINMIVAYLIGRYIRKYNIEIKKDNIIKIMVISVSITFIIMSIITFIKHKVTLGYMFRDNSIFVIITATCIFMIFKSLNIENKKINYMSQYVFAAYICEELVRKQILGRIINLEYVADKWYFYVIAICYVVITFIICMVIEKIRNIIFNKL